MRRSIRSFSVPNGKVRSPGRQRRPAIPAGRPREFVVENALDRAVEVFWRQGFEGTSLTDLTDAMAINRPSLYATFGNKERLFVRALSRYRQTVLTYLDRALAQPTVREVTGTYLRAHVLALTAPGTPPGCLYVQGGLAGTAQNAGVSHALAAARTSIETALRERFEADLDPAAAATLGGYLSTVATGLAVAAGAGTARRELTATVEFTLGCWPA